VLADSTFRPVIRPVLPSTEIADYLRFLRSAEQPVKLADVKQQWRQQHAELVRNRCIRVQGGKVTINRDRVIAMASEQTGRISE